MVDDELEVRRALADMLELEGHVPVECPDGMAALRALERESFDLVLTDLGMPGSEDGRSPAPCSSVIRACLSA